jgi:transposase
MKTNQITDIEKKNIREKYITEGKDAKQLAKIFNVSTTSVYKILKSKEFTEEQLEKRNKIVKKNEFSSVLKMFLK